MRTRRAKNRTTSRYANVIEHLESRYLLTDLVGDTPATATDLGTLTAAQPIELFGTIDAAFDLDVFQFQAGTQETATIELSANFSSLDTFVRLLDSSGNELAFDDDSGPGTNSLLRFTVTGGATFFVEAGDLFDGTGDFFLSISLDVGDTINDATFVGTLTAAQPIEVFGAVEEPFDLDFFQFQAGTDAVTLVEVSANFSGLDTFVTVFDAFGNQIAFDDDGGPGLDSRLIFSIESNETYFVQVRGFSGSTGDYELNLSVLPDVVGDTRETATNLGLLTAAQPLQVSGVINVAFDGDLFQFQAASTETSTIQLNAEFSNLDAFVTLFDSLGNQVAADDDSGPGRDSLLRFTIDGGETYFVEARGLSTSIGAFHLTITLDVGDSTATATDLGILAAGAQLDFFSSIDEANDHDVFRLQTDFDGPVVIALGADFSALDSVLTLRDSLGNVIAANDNISQETTNSRLNVTLEAGETYFVEASGSATSIGNYHLTFSPPAATLGILTGLNPLATEGTIEVPFSSDLFQFQADAAGDLAIAMSSRLSFLDTFITLLDSSGNQLASDDDSGPGANSFLVFPIDANETYFVRASGFFSSTGDYSLNLSFLADDFGDSVLTASALPNLARGASQVVVGTLESASDADVFRIDVAVGSVLELSATSPVSANILVVSAGGGSQTFFAGQRFSMADGDSAFLQVFPTFFGQSPANYSITIESVITDNRHDSHATAARIDDPVGDDSENITRSGNSFQITGQLETTSDLDFFTFVAPFTGVMTINASLAFGGSSSYSPLVDLDVFESDFGTFVIAHDLNAALARSADGLDVFVYEGLTYFVSLTNQGDTTGPYELNLAPARIAGDDFPDLIGDDNVPVVVVTSQETVTGQITNEDFFFDFDVVQIAVPPDSLLSVSTTTFNVSLTVIVQSPDNSRQFFSVSPSSSQRVPVGAEDEIFLVVSSFLDIPYQITLQTVATDGRHDSFATAAATNDPVGDDAEEITQDGDSFAITGQLQTIGDQDFFAFVAPSTGFLTVTAPTDVAGVNAASLQFDLELYVSSFGSNFLFEEDVNAVLARTSANGLPFFVFEGDMYFVSVINRGNSTGAYRLDLAPLVKAPDDFPETIDAPDVPIVVVTSSAVMTGEITNDFFFLDFDVIEVDAPADSLLRVSTTSFDVSVEVIVQSLEGTESFFVDSVFNQDIPITADDQVFLRVSSFFNTSYEVSLRTVVTDGRHDTFNTAARTDDPAGDDAEQIAQSTDAFVITGQLETTDDLDFFAFTAPFTGELRISAPSSSAVVNSADLSFGVRVFDPVVDPFNFVSQPFLVASDADGQQARSENGLTIFVFEGVPYFVEVANHDDSTGAYQLNLARVTDNFANDFATAAPVTLTNNRGSVDNGQLDSAFDADFFSFVAGQTGAVQITLSPGIEASGQTSNLAAFFEAYSAPNFGSFLTGEFAFNNPTTIDFSVVAGQTYFFAVFNSGFGEASFQASIQPLVVPDDDVPAAGRAIPEFSSANPTIISGSIETRGDIDTFRLTADSTRSLQFTLEAASGSALDTVLTVQVFDSSDTSTTPVSFSFNDDFGGSLNSFLSVPVTAGQTVQINARGFGSSRGAYQLTISSGDSLKPNEPESGSIETPFSQDIYNFTAAATGVATVAVNAASNLLDPIVTITNASASNAFVAFDDDSGPGLNSLVTFGVVQGQTYGISVGGYGTSTGAYEVSLTLVTSTTDDFGNTFGQAAALTFQNDSTILQEGAIETGDDVDVFSFNATSDGTLNLSVASRPPGFQAGFSVFQLRGSREDGNFELIAVSDPPSALDSTTNVFVSVEAGLTYFVRVVGLPNSAGQSTTGEYVLRATPTADQIPAAPPPDGVAIPLVGDVGEVTGQIDFETDRDWYRIVAPSSGYFTINLDRTFQLDATGISTQDGDLDPLLTVYDERQLTGETERRQFSIARNDDRQDSTLDSQLRIQARTTGEVFYVEAAGVLNSTGGYRVSVSFEPDVVTSDVGDNLSQAFPITLSTDSRTTNLRGTLELAQDQDFYSFTAVADASITLDSLTALPAGAEFRVFQVGAPTLAEVSIDTLTQIGSSSQNIEFDVQSQTSYLIAVVHTGVAQSLPIEIDYNFNLTLSPSKSEDLSELESAAQAALLSLADDAASAGDRDPETLRNAAMAAVEKLQLITGQTFLVLVVDPVNEFRAEGSGGRQVGLTNGTINEFQGGVISAGIFGQIVIVPFTPGETVNLSLAGFGANLEQSFSAFTVGPSGVQRASQEGARTTTNADGKTNFVVQLGFGDTVIPTPSTASNAQSPSFFMMTNNGRLSPSGETTPSGIDDSAIVQIDLDRPDREPEPLPFPGDLEFWLEVLDGVLQELHIEGLSRPSLDRVLNRFRENDSKLPTELMMSSPVVRSAKAMYDAVKHSAGWFRNAKPTTPPAPKQRTPVPKVTLETPSPKNASQARIASKKMTHLGG